MESSAASFSARSGRLARRELLDGVLTLFGLLLDDGGKLFVGDGPHEFHLQVLRRRLQKAQHTQAQGILGLVGGNVVLLDTRCQRHDNSREMMIEKTRKAERTSVYPPLSPTRLSVPVAGKTSGTKHGNAPLVCGRSPAKKDGMHSRQNDGAFQTPWSFPFPHPGGRRNGKD